MERDIEKPDKIHIRDLLVRCIIGTRRNERVKKQDVLINITLYADIAKACETDNISDTVDYHYIKEDIVAMVEQSSFFLVERLAGAVAEICLRNDLVFAVSVTVEKPGALRYARNVGVEILRKKTTYTGKKQKT